MAEGRSKPSIPAWQRALPQTPSSGADTTTVERTPGPDKSTTKDEPAEQAEASAEASNDEESVPPSDGTSQLDMVDAVLADPDIKDAPLEKKRTLLANRHIPVETIDQVLQPKANKIESADFQAFKQQQQPAQARSVPPSPGASGPPIITYPEFLVQAHQQPPLITPSRIINTAYIAGGLATLVYGASKYLLTPMVESLTEARHDFATHSQDKLEEFNDRLSKIVSHVPEARKGDVPASETDGDDLDSITSDPTELFHRDMGTQTSPLPSRRSSSLESSTAETSTEKTTVAHHVTSLTSLNARLTELLVSVTKQEALSTERQLGATQLRHYLATLMYASPSVTSWGTTEDASATKGAKAGKVDAVEELKREIRGVKGVLLSARRFPSAAAGGGGGMGRGVGGEGRD